MAWRNVRRWRWSPQITSLLPWTPRALLLLHALTKTIWVIWPVFVIGLQTRRQRRSRCTCQRCGAHLYSNIQLSPMPAARGGACTVWLGLLPFWGNACTSDCRMSRSCWLISRRKNEIQVWVCGCVYNSVHRCIPFQLCSCLYAFFVSLWFACLRDHNDSLSIKTESCVDRRGWEVYEAYKHSCILHVDKWSLRKGLRNENWQEYEECRKTYISLWVFRPHCWND